MRGGSTNPSSGIQSRLAFRRQCITGGEARNAPKGSGFAPNLYAE